MAETYIISDTHWGHANSLTFLRDDGTKLRDFSSVEEMDEHMIHRWNSVVRPQDKVIHLGDVVINRKYLKHLQWLNGDKKLIMGNHDIFALKDYAEYFYDIKAYRVFDKYVFSHIPVHTDSIERWHGNIHGHLHEKKVFRPGGGIDQRYLCMSVEQAHVDYTPVPWYRVKEIMNARQNA